MRSELAPRASDDSRQSRVPPLISSMTLSKPNAVRRTLRAAIPAPIASTASTAIHTTVASSSRTPARTAACLKSAGAEQAVSEIPQSRHDVGLVVEPLVERRRVDVDLGMTLLEYLPPLASGHDADHPRVAPAGLLDEVQRLGGRSAGGQHRVEQQRHLALQHRQLLVVDARHGGLFVSLQADVAEDRKSVV